MPVTTSPPNRSPMRDLHFMGDPSSWLNWRFLPVVRRQQNGNIEYGVLFDAHAVSKQTSYRCTVFRTNLFLLPRRLDEFMDLPKEVYDTFDELVAAGWRVD